MKIVNTRRVLLWGAVLVALVLPFTGCKPIPYYLERVLKVYGKVTDAKTGEPLESVEVSIASYQYSDLTNGLGDYELEMAAGTWALLFTREGYEDHLTDPITFDPSEPRVRIDVGLKPIAPQPGELVGVWFGANQPYVDNPASADMRLVFHDDGTYQQLNAVPGTLEYYDGSIRGTYSATNGNLQMHVTGLIWEADPVTGEPTAWTPFEIEAGTAAYTRDGEELQITIDLSGWGGAANTVWTLYLQPSNLVGVWSGLNQPFIAQFPYVDLQETYGTYGYVEQLVSDPTSHDYIPATARGRYYTTAGGILHTHITETLDNYDPSSGFSWLPADLPESAGTYALSQDALTITSDLSGWGGASNTVWTLNRQ